MLSGLKEGMEIETKHGKAIIIKIGGVHKGKNSCGWAMMTLNIEGSIRYAVAHEFELASDYNNP